MTRLFLVIGARDFESHRLAQQFFERRDVPMGRPQLEFRVAVRPQPNQIVVPAWEQVKSAERLRVAAIQTLGEADHRGESADGLPQRAGEVAESLV
jgi:uncharacterized protein YbaA (DUF1428 family)